MKAVVVETRGKNAALLSEDGCVIKVKNKSYEIGQEVKIEMKSLYKSKKAAGIIAAAACFVLISGGSALAYYTPTTYVSLDVNPSIEYSLNMFDRVLSVKGVNDDGSEIVKDVQLDNLSNKTIDEAIELTVKQIADAGYFNSGDGGIEITTSAKDLKRASELADDLQETAEQACEEKECEAEVNAEAVGAERVEEAKELGVTPGKLNLVEKMIDSASDPSGFDKTEWLGKPVKDIMKQTKENKEQNKDKNKEQNGDESVIEESGTETSETVSATDESVTGDQSEITQSETSKVNNGKGKDKNPAESKTNENKGKSNESIAEESETAESEDTESEEAVSESEKPSDVSKTGKGNQNGKADQNHGK